MKVIFEGTLEEIKKEIAIFLWEGSIWATKEEIETRLPSTLYEEIKTKKEIAIDLRKWINHHPDLDQLPSEMKIARKYKVSRMTARAGIQILKDEGLIYSQNQKTFIA
tara:strand:- start:1893 stop:2216 length:324 start_codon:yes stop_codon:yes gene_type:complete